MSEHRQLSRDGRSITVRVPLEIRMHGGRKLVLVPDDAPDWAPVRSHIDTKLVKALARGRRWQQLLEGGQYATTHELAAARRSIVLIYVAYCD